MKFLFKLSLLSLFLFIAFQSEILYTSDTKKTTNKSVSIEELKMLNENYVRGELEAKDILKMRAKNAKGQAPHTIIVTCSDSRVVPEYIFDSGIGDLFIIRTAGNVIDEVGLGSVEYAAEHLHAGKIIVMGHTSCGAVTAALKGKTESENINAIINLIEPAVAFVKSKHIEEKDEVLATVIENVKSQIKNIKNSKIISELIEKNKLDISGAVYDLESGKVEFLK